MLGHISLSFVAVAVASGAGLASAFSLSQTCQSTLESLVTSPQAACLNPSAFLPFIVGGSNSIPDTINNWVNGVCTTGSCTNDTLAAVVTNVTTGCSQELQSFGISSTVVSDVITIVQEAYPTVRQVMCLQNETTSTLCVTETITNVETVVGNLQINDLSFLNIVVDIQNLISTGIQSIACTSCTQAAFGLINNNFGSILQPVESDVAQLCGANFVNSPAPNGISETAVSGVFTEQKNNNKAVSLGPLSSPAGLVLVAVSSLFMIL